MRNERFENSGTSNETTSTSQLVRYGYDRLVLLQLLRTYGAGFTPLKANAFFRETGRPFKKFQLRSSRFLLAWDLPCHLGLRDASPAGVLGLGSPLILEGMAAPLSN